MRFSRCLYKIWWQNVIAALLQSKKDHIISDTSYFIHHILSMDGWRSDLGYKDYRQVLMCWCVNSTYHRHLCSMVVVYLVEIT